LTEKNFITFTKGYEKKVKKKTFTVKKKDEMRDETCISEVEAKRKMKNAKENGIKIISFVHY
jgi:hypothetical protein